MTAKDQLKLLNAGFMIIRRDNEGMRIKIKRKHHSEWRFVKDLSTQNPATYKNKSQLNKAVNDLLKSDKIIED